MIFYTLYFNSNFKAYRHHGYVIRLGHYLIVNCSEVDFYIKMDYIDGFLYQDGPYHLHNVHFSKQIMHNITDICKYWVNVETTPGHSPVLVWV